MVDANDVAKLKADILAAGMGSADLVRAAWAAASTFGTRIHGRRDGGRLRLAPRNWAATRDVGKVLTGLEAIQTAFNGAQTNGKVSWQT